MRRRLFRVLLSLLIASMAACAHAPKTLPERILLVGNSLIYRNDLPAHLAAIASEARGAEVQVEMIAGGGQRIDQHAARGIVQRELATGRYTVLVLQEWGRGLRCDPEFAQFGFNCVASHASHRALVDAARSRGVRVLLLGTYSTDAEDARGLEDAERVLAETLAVEHVGLGDWLGLRARLPARAWLDADGAHPGADLTLFMALKLTRTLYGTVPWQLPLRLMYRDYRGDAAPAPDALTSTQTVLPRVFERQVTDADLADLRP